MRNLITVDQFVRLIELSGLLPPESLRRVLRHLDEHEVIVGTPVALGEWIVSEGLLTRWQTDKLLDGKHEGFLLGNYRMLGLLGQGAMGTVYLAEHMLMHRRCALKLLHPNRFKDSDFLTRFLREGRAAAAMSHPNIITAYELNTARQADTDLYFLAMELADGMDLQRLVDESGPLSEERAIDIALQVARGLEYAHSCNLIHRDIKPTNLFVSTQGVVKILDFGLVRFHEEHDLSDDGKLDSFHNETFLGTAGYLAPEQAMNSSEVDPRADLYGLGATIYFMLIGQPPFNEGTIVRRLLASQVQPAPNLRAKRPEISEEFNSLVMSLLQPKPENRPASATEVIGRLTLLAPASALVQERGDVESEPVEVAVLSNDNAAADTELCELIVSDSVTPSSQRQTRRTRRLATVAASLFSLAAFIVALQRADYWPFFGDDLWEPDYVPSFGVLDDRVPKSQRIGQELRSPTDIKADQAPGALSPLARLKVDRVDPYERRMAEQEADGPIPGLVSVIGDSRLTHWGPIRRATFRPHTSELLTTSADGTLRLWDSQTGNEIKTVYRGLPMVEFAAYSRDGERLCMGLSNGVCEMQTADGQLVWSRKVVESPVRGIVFDSINNSVLAIADRVREVLVLDAKTGELLRSVALSAEPKSLVQQSDGSQVAVALSSKSIAIMDVSSDATLFELKGHQAIPDAVSFTADGSQRLVSTSSVEREVIYWDLKTRQEISRTVSPERLMSVTAELPGDRMLMGLGWGLVHTTFGTKEIANPLRAHFNSIRDIVISSDESRVATVGDDFQIRLWKWPSLERLFDDLPSYDAIRDISLSADGATLAISDFEWIRQYSLVSEKFVRRYGPHSSVVSAVSLSPNAGSVVGASIFQTELRSWDTLSGLEQWQHPLGGRLNALATSPNALRLVLACLPNPKLGMKSESMGSILNAESGEVVAELERVKDDNAAQALAWSPDGSCIAGCGRRSVTIWDSMSGKRQWGLNVPRLRVPPVLCCSFSADSRAIFAGTPDGRVLAWPVDSDTPSLLFQQEDAVLVTSVAASADGAWLSWTCSDGVLRLRSTQALPTDLAATRSIRLAAC